MGWVSFLRVFQSREPAVSALVQKAAGPKIRKVAGRGGKEQTCISGKVSQAVC